MSYKEITAADFRMMLRNAEANLKQHCDEVNDLNVFPVPDGDTGLNMCMTLRGGVGALSETNDLSVQLAQVARGMLLSARGNSGVILSQLFKGLSLGLPEGKTADAAQLTKCLLRATQQAYQAVNVPTEGTILTVAREAGEYAKEQLRAGTTIESLLDDYISQLERTLRRTPDMLACLKQAGVVDSGGMGYVYIIRGMAMALAGQIIEEGDAPTESVRTMDTAAFNADSELEYGYCTEFILQLQNSKCNPAAFETTTMTDYLAKVGDSIVCVKDMDVVKVHVHTKTPALVIGFAQQFGEFVTFKMENMSVQHNEVMAHAAETKPRVHKDVCVVAVASGSGLTDEFLKMGVDIVIPGGQSMNPSAQDFLEAFAQLDCDDIIVLPNNGNIILTAKQAAENYADAKVHVIRSKSLAQGYSALTMLDTANNSVKEVISTLHATIENVATGEITYAVRDSVYECMPIHMGDTLAMLNDRPVASCPDRVQAVITMLKAVEDLEDREVMTILCGQDAVPEETEQILAFMEENYPFTEVGTIEAQQPIYSYIFAME